MACVVVEQLYGEAVFGIVHGNSPYWFGVLFGFFVSFEAHNLIYEYFRVNIVRQVTLFNSLINQVVLDSDHKGVNTKIILFFLVKTTSFTFFENYLGHYWYNSCYEQIKKQSDY